MPGVDRFLIQADRTVKSTKGDRICEHADGQVTVIEVGRWIPARMHDEFRYFAASAIQQLGLVGKVIATELNAKLLLFSVTQLRPTLVLYAVGGRENVLAGDCKRKSVLGSRVRDALVYSLKLDPHWKLPA